MMIERDRRIYKVNKGRSGEQDLDSRAMAITAKARTLGISCHRLFGPDLLWGRLGGIGVIEAILDVVESGQLGIIVEEEGQKPSLTVVRPDGKFSWRGYSGVLLRVGFLRDEYSRSARVVRQISRADDETVTASRIWSGAVITNVNFGSNRQPGAVYEDGILRRLRNPALSYFSQFIHKSLFLSKKAKFKPVFLVVFTIGMTCSR